MMLLVELSNECFRSVCVLAALQALCGGGDEGEEEVKSAGAKLIWRDMSVIVVNECSEYQ